MIMEIKASTFFSDEDQDQIRSSIKEAERSTSGEIRVHIETQVSGEVLDRAAWIFQKIGMDKTDNRNGVLFYLAVKNRQFAVIGDKGINARVPEDFWDNIMMTLQENFKNEKFAGGLIRGILMAGQQLKEHFPRQTGDVNELPDEISFDNPV